MSPDPIALRNLANAQFSTGPRTADGKAVSSGNAVVHGYCAVEPRSPEDRVEAAALYAMLAAELKPTTPMEVEAVRDAANADQRRRRLGRALEDAFAMAAQAKQDERKAELAAHRDRCQAEVDLWTGLIAHPPEVGQGLDPDDFKAILNNFGVSGLRRRDQAEDPRVNILQFFQGRARGGQPLREALANQADGETLSEADQRAIHRSRRACDEFVSLFQQSLKTATERLAEAGRKIEQNRENPSRTGDWFDDSKRAQLLFRYQGEATRDYFRALRSLDAIRRRQDAERRQKEREERQARKAVQDAEKAAKQAARQAEIDARAKPVRNELVAKVIEPFLPESAPRNEPRPAVESAEIVHPDTVAPEAPSSSPDLGDRRLVQRRGKAVVVPNRRPPNRA